MLSVVPCRKRLLSQKVDAAKRLIEGKADVLNKDIDGWYSATCCKRKRSSGTCQINFVAEGADLKARSIRNPPGLTPLMTTCYQVYTDVSTYLIQRGAKTDPRNLADTQQAIHIASHNGDPALLKLLLDAGGDIEKRNNDGETPLIVAAREESIPNVEFLLKHGANMNAQTRFGNDLLQHCRKCDAGSSVQLLEQWLHEHGGRLASDKAKSRSLERTTTSTAGDETW